MVKSKRLRREARKKMRKMTRKVGQHTLFRSTGVSVGFETDRNFENPRPLSKFGLGAFLGV